MLSVKALGHVGLYCTDLQKSKDFYTRILGLAITDESPDGQMTFLSARPDEEHHELALCTGRDIAPGAKVVQQISFIVEDLDVLKQFHEHLIQEKVRIRSIVTHGIAFAIYFYDPDDNVVEIYAKTPYKVTQPVSEPIISTYPNQNYWIWHKRVGCDNRFPYLRHSHISVIVRAPRATGYPVRKKIQAHG